MHRPPDLERLVTEELAERIRGRVLGPGDEGYDEARRIWNARLQRRPGVIARCAGAADVVASVELARERELPPAVKSGGHGYGGRSSREGGLLVDLSPMRAVRVDPDARIARVQAGARWADVDRATQAVGLATTGATVSTVGVAGFTLGGGSGHLARKHGLAIDNLLAAELVTADGRLVRASASENSENDDLFWAVRGGGGAFGVATAFELRFHDVGPEILAGQVVYPLGDAPEVLCVYRDVMAEAPEALTCYPFFLRVPPVPAFPESVHGTVAIDLVLSYAGPSAEGREAIAALRGIADPLLDHVEPQPYRAVHRAFDEGVPKGLRWYTRAHYLPGVPDEAIDVLSSYVEHLRGPYTMVYLEPLGGAIGRVDPAATAFPHRDAAYGVHILAGCEDPAQDEEVMGWARAFHGALAPHATGGVYLNLVAEDEAERARRLGRQLRAARRGQAGVGSGEPVPGGPPRPTARVAAPDRLSFLPSRRRYAATRSPGGSHMSRTTRWILAAALLVPSLASAQQGERYDYFEANREMIRRGVQAVLQCNGLFTSNRTLEQVFAQELAYLREPVGMAEGGDYVVDRERKGVAIGAPGGDVPVMRAAFREGIGCVVMAPDQTFEEIDELPAIDAPPPPGDPAEIPWPDGDLVAERPLPDEVDPAALAAASEWAFDRESPEQVTLSLLVVHDGRIIHERYAPGVDASTRTRTWSTAKSIAVTLIGMLVDRGRLSLDEPLPIEWLPERASSPETDPRRRITLRHVLHMSSGLYPVDSWGREYATGSGLAYWAGASSIDGARDRGLVREPGTSWDYENYDTLLGVLAMKGALGSDSAYHAFPRQALLDRIGMRNTLLSTDRFGDFILSSQVYTNARDLARFGMLYEQGGVWNGERLLSEEWIAFVRTPAPATVDRGSFYGGQFWLVPDDRTDVPADAYSTAGNRGQYVVIVPSHDLVIVRRGLDYGRQGFDRWDLTREVLKAVRPSATDR